MSADVLALPAIGAAADETVRRSIRALIEGRGVDKDEMARAIGMTRTTLYRRLGGRGSTQAFSAGEAALIAQYFQVPITSLYDGLGGAVVARLTREDGVSEFRCAPPRPDCTTVARMRTVPLTRPRRHSGSDAA